MFLDCFNLGVILEGYDCFVSFKQQRLIVNPQPAGVREE